MAGDEAAPNSEVVAGADAWPNMDGVLLRLKPAAEEAPAKGAPGGGVSGAEGTLSTQPLLVGRNLAAPGKGVAAQVEAISVVSSATLEAAPQARPDLPPKGVVDPKVVPKPVVAVVAPNMDGAEAAACVAPKPPKPGVEAAPKRPGLAAGAGLVPNSDGCAAGVVAPKAGVVPNAGALAGAPKGLGVAAAPKPVAGCAAGWAPPPKEKPPAAGAPKPVGAAGGGPALWFLTPAW